ncbi:ABC transporter permease [Paenibacillus sp. GCM10027626]|uniref:ABC transporter permease n=1 Tax=Paenibacillus sp. GCM10027626 TaxID=3273411 RepID=UPI003639363B
MLITKKTLFHRIWYFKAIYAMLLPAALFYIIFCYFPMYGIIIAFKDYMLSKGIMGSPWTGLDHFHTIFGLDKFWEVMFNTVYINVLKLIWGFPAPIILALLLNEVRVRLFKRTVQTIIYLPHFISWVTIAGIVTALLSVDDGIVNNVIVWFGTEKIDFLTNSDLFRPLLVTTGIWKEVGWSTIIYFAAISGISPELYEASVMDGASRWRQTWHITLPGIAPTISILLILTMGSMMAGGFDQVFNLYNPMVYDVGDTIDTYIYRTGIGEGKFSMATAVGLFLNVINFVLLFSVNKLSKRISGIGIY